MKHLREKIQFLCFEFRKVQEHELDEVENIAPFDCLLSL